MSFEALEEARKNLIIEMLERLVYSAASNIFPTTYDDALPGKVKETIEYCFQMSEKVADGNIITMPKPWVESKIEVTPFPPTKDINGTITSDQLLIRAGVREHDENKWLFIEKLIPVNQPYRLPNKLMAIKDRIEILERDNAEMKKTIAELLSIVNNIELN